MAPFLKTLRKATKSLPTKKMFDNAVTSIKTAKSGITSIDEVFANLPFTKRGDELLVNGKRLRASLADIRVGNIRKVLRDMKIPNNITAGDEAAFKKLIGSKVPEIEINKMNRNINTAKKFHSDLDIKASTGKDIEQQLTPKSKAKLTASYKTIFKIAGGVATTGVGLYTAIVFTGNIFEDIAKATKAREGCYVVRKVNNVTSSCKLILRSCGVENGTACRGNIADNLSYNMNIMLNHFVQNNDSESLNEIGKILNISINKTTNIDTVLAQTGTIDKLQKFYESRYSQRSQVPFSNPCALYKRTSGCVACNPSATTNSELYVDDSNLAENYSLQCVTNSTVLETLVDVATNMGIDIFDAATFSLRGRGNIIFCATFVILLVILFVSLGLKFMRNNTKYMWENNQDSSKEPLLTLYRDHNLLRPMS